MTTVNWMTYTGTTYPQHHARIDGHDVVIKDGTIDGGRFTLWVDDLIVDRFDTLDAAKESAIRGRQDGASA